ncbi:flippase-like domain-containing protein [Candidatus Parcubacteria bacterium]|nr:flippase-like domain-containing protein [Candidatus Parcubacteria bacterium]
MKKIIFLSASLIIGFILFFIALKKVGLENIFSVLSGFDVWQISLILGLFLFGLVIGALRWKIILDTQHSSPVRFSDIFIAKFIGHSINYLTPVMFAGGEPFKALVLKARAKVPIDKGLTSIVIEEVIFLSVSFVFAVLGVVLLLAHFTLPLYFIVLLVALIIFCLFILYIFYSKTINNKSKKGFFVFFIETLCLDKIDIVNGIKPKINEIEQEISDFFKEQRGKVINACILSVIEILLLILSYWLIIIFLKKYLCIWEVVSINALIHLVSIIPIPASLGSFEWSQAFIFSIFGLGSDTGIAFSLIVRCVMLTITGLGILLLVNFEIKTLIEKAKIIAQKFGKIVDKL